MLFILQLVSHHIAVAICCYFLVQFIIKHGWNEGLDPDPNPDLINNKMCLKKTDEDLLFPLNCVKHGV